MLVRSAHNGWEYDIRVALPRSYADTSRRFPVLYVLDGNALFGLAGDVARLLSLDRAFPELLVVGIGYPPSERRNTLQRRLAEFTPTNVPQEDSLQGVQARAPEERSGNAAAFRQALLREILPAVERGLRIDTTRRVLWGYSLGGLFALNVLLEHREVFAGYLVTSPSLWWDGGWLFKREDELASRLERLPVRMFVSVGALEQAADPWAGMATNVERLRKTLIGRRYGGLEVTALVFADETHLSTPGASLSRGLRTLMAK